MGVREEYEQCKYCESLLRGKPIWGGVDLDDGDNVVIKINLCDFRPPETGAITHPKFLAALLKYLRTNFRGLKIKVVESLASQP